MGPEARPTRTQPRPSSWSMPETTRRAVSRPSAPRSLRLVATATPASPAGPGEPPSLFDDFKFVILSMPCSRGLHQRAHGLDRAPLPPDDPAELRRIDGQLEHEDSVLLERAHRDRVGVVDEVPGHRFDPGLDVRFRHVRHPSGGRARRARPLQQPLHGRRGVGPLLDPAVRLEDIDLHDHGFAFRIVVADLVRDLRARRARRLGHHDMVERLVLRPRPAQTNHQHSVTSLRVTAVERAPQRLNPRAAPNSPGPLPGPPRAMVFIILRICLNCFRSRLMSDTDVPEPRAMRSLRLPSIRSGRSLSSRVIDDRMARVRVISFSSSGMSRNAPAPGSMSTICRSEPRRETFSSWEARSSRVNSLFLRRRARSSASSLEATSSAFSMRVSTSPIPRIREAMRSGWNGSRLSVCSPTPTNLTGTPSTLRIESTAPPRESPSAFERMMPVRPTRAWKADAARTASWPVIASATYRISAGSRLTLRTWSSVMSSSSMCSLPAVSTISGSRPTRRASLRASRQTSAGAAPGPTSATGTPICFPRTRSWSTAAGRRTSAGTSRGERPWPFSSRASLALVVVFPEP